MSNSVSTGVLRIYTESITNVAPVKNVRFCISKCLYRIRSVVYIHVVSYSFIVHTVSVYCICQISRMEYFSWSGQVIFFVYDVTYQSIY